MVAQTTTTTLNNSALIASAALLSSSSSRTSSPSPSRHSRSCSEPVLARSLPPLSHLEAVGQQSAKDAKHRQILADALAVAVETPLDAYDAPPPEAALVGATGGGAAPGNGSRGSTGKGKPPGTRFESYHVLQAIEKRQTMLLFEIRNEQFDLLLQPVGGATPLVHAMRLGASHREITILLTGAISRRVNDFTDEELTPPINKETRALLHSIRTNLKLAISHGLASSDTALIASFLQVLIMSEGDRWLLTSSHNLSLALRSGPSGRPVHNAEQAVDKWVHRELKKAQVAAVQDYISNAVGDLVLLGIWSLITDSLPGPPIPLYFFARDDRILKALEERIEDIKSAGKYLKLNKTVRKQLETALDVLGRRTLGIRERVVKLRAELDEE